MSISHDKASQFIHADLDGTLTPADRAELEKHLSACPRCRAEGQHMAYLDRHLRASMPGRWRRKHVTLADLDQIAGRVNAGSKRRAPFFLNSFSWLGSAVQYGAVAIAMGVMAWMLGAFANRGGTLAETGTEAPGAEPITETAAPEQCAATVSSDLNIYDRPNPSGQVVGVFQVGNILLIRARYQDAAQATWYQLPQGWVLSGDALSLQGDCTGIPQLDDASLPGPGEDVTATLSPEEPTSEPTLTPTEPATPTPSAIPPPTNPVATDTLTPESPSTCQVPAYDTLDVWTGPGEQYDFVSTIPKGASLTVYGRTTDVNEIPWLLIGTQAPPFGWVQWYPWLAGDILTSCPGVPEVNDATPFPTLTPDLPTPTQAPRGNGVTVTCTQTTVIGMVDPRTPYVRATVNLASNLNIQLAQAVVSIQSDGSFSVTLTYPAQPVGTRLIVAYGEWDGAKFTKPATLLGQDCIGS